MVEMQNQVQSHRWWFDSHSGSRRSQWLQSTLAELDEKTGAMLKLIEEDADSFAQRAEMYYKKRPELITMVENFYRAHRSLAERYDLLKSDSGTPRVLTNFSSPFSSKKSHSVRSMSTNDQIQAYINYDTSDVDDFAESEVEDPEQEYEILVDKEMNNQVSSEVHNDDEAGDTEKDQFGEEVSSQVVIDDGLFVESETRAKNIVTREIHNDETVKLRVQVEKLRSECMIQKEILMQKEEETREVIRQLSLEAEKLRVENMIQKEQLMQKDEEKREVIRQLSLAVGVLKDENSKLKKYVAAAARNSPNKWSHFEFNKLMKGGFLGKLFNVSTKSQPSIVAL